MRLWVRHGDRLPDPPPMPTNDRLALAVGFVGWVIAGLVAVGMLALSDITVSVSALITIAVGLALGVAGWIATAPRR
jgi:hypothetical protein